MGLSFETPADAAKCAKSLRVWADFMDANADKQIDGDYYDGDGMCAIGAGGRAFGYHGDGFPDWVLEDEGINDRVQDVVGAVVVRQLGLNCKLDPAVTRTIPLLNDALSVTFPQFATACRTLASMIEEHFDTGTVVVEAPALVEVTA